MERAVLASVALAVIVLAGWRGARAGHAALAAFGCAVSAGGVVAACALTSLPAVACLILHLVATFVARTLSLHRAHRGSLPFRRGVAYVLLAPTLDPRRAFLPDPAARRGEGLRDGLLGVAELAAAVGVCVAGERLGLLGAGPWPAAWVRAISLALILDGFTRSCEGFTRSAGLHAERCFDRPWLARDAGEFWGGRWNRFVGRALFHEVYRPWARRVGPWSASLLAFGASGLLHEVLWVLPTGTGAGHYLAFFGLQWCGAAASSRIRHPGARRAWLWLTLAATTPLFFGEAAALGMPLERLLD